ncbi:hypothetical protein ACQ4WX_01000 [Streptomyces lasalocidi]
MARPHSASTAEGGPTGLPSGVAAPPGHACRPALGALSGALGSLRPDVRGSPGCAPRTSLPCHTPVTRSGEHAESVHAES